MLYDLFPGIMFHHLLVFHIFQWNIYESLGIFINNSRNIYVQKFMKFTFVNCFKESTCKLGEINIILRLKQKLKENFNILITISSWNQIRITLGI